MDIQTCRYNMDYDTLDIRFIDGQVLHLARSVIEGALSLQPSSCSRLRKLLDQEPETYAALFFDGKLQEYCDRVARSHDEQYNTIEEQMVHHFNGDRGYAAAIAREIMMYNS